MRHLRLLAKALVIALLFWMGAQNAAFAFRTGKYFDFGSFIAAGEAANFGLNPYGPWPLVHKTWHGTEMFQAVNLNAPLSVLTFQPLARLDHGLSHVLWLVGSYLVFAAVVLWLARRFHATPNKVLALLLLDGAWTTLVMGQVYSFLLLPAALGFFLLRHRPILAGACLGFVVAFKPSFLLWLVFLICARHYRVTAATAAATLAWAALPLAFGHAAWYGQWLTVASQPYFSMSPLAMGIPSIMTRLGFPNSAATIPSLVLIGLLALLTIWRRPSVEHAVHLGTVSTLLLSPVTWTAYTVFLAPFFLARQIWSWPMRVALGCLLVPATLYQELTALAIVPTIGLVLCEGLLVAEMFGPLRLRMPTARLRYRRSADSTPA